MLSVVYKAAMLDKIRYILCKKHINTQFLSVITQKDWFSKLRKMENLQVTVEEGTLKGTTDTDLDGKKYYRFLGIPYAKPPIGKLRFKAPQPAEKWTGIREAITDTGASYSNDFYLGRKLSGSEDCLVLNVYTPELPQNKPILKPVMVWIHGGGFVWGSNNSNVYGPQFLITEDVVIVAINYRLGFLGFLATDDPDLGTPGNAGLKDMVMALKWVQANIKQFSGDSNNVTIFGESAGGAAVHYLVLSPMAKGLFHRAIAQSGCVVNPWAQGKSSARELAKALDYTSSSEEDILTYLQSLSYEEIYKGQQILEQQFGPNSLRPVGPLIEKVTSNEPAFLSENPIDIISKGNYNNVPFIMGYTDEEGLIIELFKNPKNTFIEDLEQLVLWSFGVERGSDLSKGVAKKIKEFYYENKEPSLETISKEIAVKTDTMFVYGIQQCLKSHVVTSNQPIYAYRLIIEGKLNFLKVFGKIQHRGTAHADDIGYLFKTYVTPDDLDPDSIEIKTVRRMVKFWANFARTGNPNPVEDVTWLPVTKEKLNYLEIGEKLVPLVNPDEERMKFWNSLESWVKESKSQL